MATTKRYCIYEFYAEIGNDERGSIFVLSEVNLVDCNTKYGIAFSPDALNMVEMKYYEHIPTYAETAAYEASDGLIKDVKNNVNNLDQEKIIIHDEEIYDGEDREEWMELIINYGGKPMSFDITYQYEDENGIIDNEYDTIDGVNDLFTVLDIISDELYSEGRHPELIQVTTEMDEGNILAEGRIVVDEGQNFLIDWVDPETGNIIR